MQAFVTIRDTAFGGSGITVGARAGGYMTRDETVALFLECEARRAEARAAALAESKSEDADDIAHEAAKAHWNAWAGSVLAQRETLEKEGRWAEASRTDFSRCLFLVRGADQRDSGRR